MINSLLVVQRRCPATARCVLTHCDQGHALLVRQLQVGHERKQAGRSFRASLAAFGSLGRFVKRWSLGVDLMAHGAVVLVDGLAVSGSRRSVEMGWMELR